MNRLTIIAAITSILILSGCDFDTSDNGDLDGYWHLEAVDTLSNHLGVDYGNRKIFWSFQGKLLQLSNLHDNSIIYKFDRQGNILRLQSPLMFDRNKGDTLVTDINVLRPYGVNTLNEDFEIAGLEDRRMVLMSTLLRLTFRKY